MLRDPDISTRTTLFLGFTFAALLLIGYSFTTSNSYTRLGAPNSTNVTCLDGQTAVNNTFMPGYGKVSCINTSQPQPNSSGEVPI